MVAGAEGNVQHVHNHDASGTIAVSVQQNTNMCRLLGILFNAQKLIGDGQIPAFTFPVTVRDNNTLPPTVHQGFNCLIMRNPRHDLRRVDQQPHVDVLGGEDH